MKQTFRRGPIRTVVHSCDICGREVQLRSAQVPAGWVDLGILGLDGVVGCTECVGELAEVVAAWVLERRKHAEPPPIEVTEPADA
jgi:hypothetical protein